MITKGTLPFIILSAVFYWDGPEGDDLPFPGPTDAELRATLEGYTTEEVSAAIDGLLQNDLLMAGTDRYGMTDAGIVAQADADAVTAITTAEAGPRVASFAVPGVSAASIAALAPAAPRTYTGSRGTYDGAELGQTCLRPGAYDAFKYPSLMNKVPSHVAS